MSDIPLWMGTCETDRNATVLHANTAEEHLTHVTLCRDGRIDCEQIFAEVPIQFTPNGIGGKDKPISTASVPWR